MQNIVKNFILNHLKLIKILLIIFLLPVGLYVVTSLIVLIFTLGNYVGTFIRGVYNYFVC